MADINDWEAPDDLATIADSFVATQRMYLCQHWGVRSGGGNPGFDNESPSMSLLGGFQIRIDPSAKRGVDWVSLTENDVRTNDRIVLFYNGKKKNLNVTAVYERPDVYRELELMNG